MIQPETKRILEEQEIINRVKTIYFNTQNIECPTDMYLQLKDLYVYFQFNQYKLIALFRDPKWVMFEDTVIRDPSLTKETLIDLYLATFDDSKLNYIADALYSMDNTNTNNNNNNTTNNGTTNNGTTNNGTATNSIQNVTGCPATAQPVIQYQYQYIIQQPQKPSPTQESLQPKQSSESSESSESSCSNKVYLPNESKIVGSGYGFDVLQKFPPICTTLGNSQEKLPDVIFYNKLQGTDLSESDIQVGSILPKFEYKRYIEIPTATNSN
jgi:hypothetical protein